MALQPGEIIDGKYRIIRELGAGSMGAVYEGENVRIRRRVAIKVLLPSVADRGDVVKRFEREAQAAGRIGSEHIVEVLDLGTLHDGGFYMVMEFLDGQTLRERIDRAGRLAPREVVPVVQQLLFGLEMAHEARIIHRDLKPDNVFLMREHAGQKDFVKILDFGISKFNPLSDDGMSMTRTGTVMGTPFYMAPEQAKGSKDIDQRSDLYSVGVILYEAVTGQKPFHAGTFNELIFKIVLETPPPPEHFVPNLDPAFSRIVRRAMARDPEQRFSNAPELRDALSVWLHTGRADDLPMTPPPAEIADHNSTRMMDPPEAATHLVRPEDRGGGTAIVAPKEAPRAPSPSRAPPPPPSKAPPRPPAPKTVPIPQAYQGLHGQTAQGQAAQIPPPTPFPGSAQDSAPGYGQTPGPLPDGTPLGMQRIPHQPLPPHAATPARAYVAPSYPDEPVASVAGVPARRSNKMLSLLIGGTVFLFVGAIAAVAFLLPGDGEADRAASHQDEREQVDHEDVRDDPEDEPSEAKEEEPVPIIDLDETSGAETEDVGSDGDEATKDSATEPPPRVAATPPRQPRPQPRPTPRPKPAPAPKPKPKAEAEGGRQFKTEL